MPQFNLNLTFAVTSMFMALSVQASPQVEIVTSKGLIVIELDSQKAPISSANFVKLVNSRQYVGTIFHRVIPEFMIQGGGYTENLSEKPTQGNIKNESKNGLKNLRGTVAMARNSDPQSASAQFYINTVDNGNLDYPSFDGWGYAVFGKVVNGMEVVDAISATTTKNLSPEFANLPVNSITIKSAKVIAESK